MVLIPLLLLFLAVFYNINIKLQNNKLLTTGLIEKSFLEGDWEAFLGDFDLFRTFDLIIEIKHFAVVGRF